MQPSPTAVPALPVSRRGRPRSTVPWDWSDIVFFFGIFLVAVYALAAILSTGLVAGIGRSLGSGFTPEARTAVNSLVQETLVYLAGIAILLALVLGRRRSTLPALGWRLPRWRWIPAAVLAAFVSLMVVGAVGLLIHALFPQAQNGQVPSVQHQYGHLIFLAIPAVSVVAPVAEETFFRGFIYGWMRRFLNVPTAAVLSGLLFAAVHGELTILAPLAVLGVILALLYEYSGSLVPSVIVHAGFNLVEIIQILGS